ncbi:UNKNOWN [Stylonychia lemnae]|uniref:Transmembrane protein n=1 Tax=Stylonychia lemnae TaxID=5949 RepID=A0A078B0J2_STYLE|nr:UNKNOWN [Stylonychia lemnae]|eukprot:CDW88175.1 UNKNOWN [Stylonychia lemnae]
MGFLYPQIPLIDYDTNARFFKERLYILCYCQIAMILVYSTYISFEHQFLQLITLFILYSAYLSLYFYTCIILLVITIIQFTFFASSSRMRADIPDILVFVVACYYILLIYYSYQANRCFRYHFDMQFGEKFSSLEEFFKAFNEIKEFEKYLKVKQYQYQYSQEVNVKKEVFYLDEEEQKENEGAREGILNQNLKNKLGNVFQPLVENLLDKNAIAQNEGIYFGRNTYMPLLNDPRTN